MLNHNHVDVILSALAFHGVEGPIFYRLRPNLKDENDNMVFERTANFGASTIITHNVKHFERSELESYKIDIVTPGRFINNLRRHT